MEIARGLGIGHVWVDSLCIIQDNLDDWATEAAKMADIYNGALLTIMAAAASDSQGGFFRDRATVKEMVALPYTDASGATELSVFVSKAHMGYERVVALSPLFRRGWVFQERLMSKRKLIFGEDQTYWDCDSAILSESKIENRDTLAVMSKQNIAAFRIFSNSSYKIDGTEHQASLAYWWAALVQEYSRCSLTYEADRLPALSGLARTFAQKFGGCYIAGLWQDQMPSSLLWYIKFHPAETRKWNYYAPSWSWASIAGQVYFTGVDCGNQELEVVSTDIKLASQDPYGRVCPGSSMRVRGRLRDGTLVKREWGLTNVQIETEYGLVGTKVHTDREDEDLPLKVIYLEVSSGDGYEHADAMCLILHRTEIDKQFRRLGMADLLSVGQDEDYLFYGLPKEVITLV